MPALLTLGGIMILVLMVLLASVYTGNSRPFYRLVRADGKYIIQYRKYVFLWRTYTLINTGEPAIFYAKDEAEDMIKTLVERRRLTKRLDKIPGSKIEIYEYSEKGSIMGARKEHL